MMRTTNNHDWRSASIEGAGSLTALAAYVGGDPIDAFALVCDVAVALGIKSDSVRAEISRRGIGPLVAIPSLKQWLLDCGAIPSRSGKVLCASSASWLPLLQSRVTNDEALVIKEQLDRLLYYPREVAEQGEEDDMASDVFTNEEDARDAVGMEHDPMDVCSSEHPLEESDSFGMSSSSSSSSSLSSDSDAGDVQLPPGVEAWVLDDPAIPSQFAAADYSKSYALKAYDVPKPLRKELKKLRKWWTKARNDERASKAVGETTAEKREVGHLSCKEFCCPALTYFCRSVFCAFWALSIATSVWNRRHD